MEKIVVLLGAVPCQTNEHFKEEHLGATAEEIVDSDSVKRYVSNILEVGKDRCDMGLGWTEDPNYLGILAVDELWVDDESVMAAYEDSNVMGAYLCEDSNPSRFGNDAVQEGRIGFIPKSASWKEGWDEAGRSSRFVKELVPSLFDWRGLLARSGDSDASVETKEIPFFSSSRFVLKAAS